MTRVLTREEFAIYMEQLQRDHQQSAERTDVVMAQLGAMAEAANRREHLMVQMQSSFSQMVTSVARMEGVLSTYQDDRRQDRGLIDSLNRGLDAVRGNVSNALAIANENHAKIEGDPTEPDVPSVRSTLKDINESLKAIRQEAEERVIAERDRVTRKFDGVDSQISGLTADVVVIREWVDSEMNRRAARRAFWAALPKQLFGFFTNIPLRVWLFVPGVGAAIASALKFLEVLFSGG
jgi:chromosome segregation ATPase